jgi:NADH dehydrogenase FAD-containing subunit
LVANYFQKNNIKGKVVVIDPREKPTTKAKGFLNAFNTLYKNTVEYRPMSNIKNIDFGEKRIFIDQFDVISKKFIPINLEFDDANIIPSNKATALLKESNLEVTSDGWGRVKNPSFQSLNDAFIYLVGDVLGEYPFPKSAQMANSCGIILGEQLAKILAGVNPEFGKELPGNVCYSMVSEEKGIYVTHQAYLKDNKVAVKTDLFESHETSTAIATHNWYAGITTNIFE